MIPLNIESPASVTTSSVRLSYIASHPNSMRNRMVLHASGIVNALLHVPTSIRVVIFPKKRTKLPKGMLFGVRTDLPGTIVLFDQAVIKPAEKRGEKEDKSVRDTVVVVNT